ncbi:MAG: FeoA family protein [Bacillota bacterium]|nr:FeoA family protein [Bacillota bacterium]
MKLIEMKPGDKAQISSILKGGNFQRKMFEMGIMPGVQIELIARHPFRGPLLIKVGQSQVALGRGVAAALDVEAK